MRPHIKDGKLKTIPIESGSMFVKKWIAPRRTGIRYTGKGQSDNAICRAMHWEKLTHDEELYICGNLLTRLPAFALEMPLLARLILAENELSAFPDISTLINLTTVDFMRNKITQIPSWVFILLKRLRTLYMNHNRLTSLPPSIQTSDIVGLYLYGNPVFDMIEPIQRGYSTVQKACVRFKHGGAQSAALTVILICKHIPARFRDVFRHVLAPMIWASRDDEEWRDADEAAYQRRQIKNNSN